MHGSVRLDGSDVREALRAVHVNGEGLRRLAGQIHRQRVSEGGSVIRRAGERGDQLAVGAVKLIAFRRAERIERLPCESDGVFRLIRRGGRIRLVRLGFRHGVEHHLIFGVEFGVYLNVIIIRGSRVGERPHAGSGVERRLRERGLIFCSRIGYQRAGGGVFTRVYPIIYAACRAVFIPSERDALARFICFEAQSGGEIYQAAEQRAQAEIFRKLRYQIVEHAHQTHVFHLVFAQTEVREVDIQDVLLRKHDFHNGFFRRAGIAVVYGNAQLDHLLVIRLVKLRPDGKRDLIGNYAQIQRLQHAYQIHVHVGNERKHFAQQVGYGNAAVGHGKRKLQRAVEERVQQAVEQRVVRTRPACGQIFFFYQPRYLACQALSAYAPSAVEIERDVGVQTGAAACFGQEQIAGYAGGELAVRELDVYRRVALQEPAGVKVYVQSHGTEQIEHRRQRCGDGEQIVVDGYIYQIRVIRACARPDYRAAAAVQRSHGAFNRLLFFSGEAGDKPAQIYGKIVIRNIGKQRSYQLSGIEDFVADLVNGQIYAQNIQTGHVHYYLVIVQINAQDRAFLYDIIIGIAAQREVAVGMQLQVKRRIFVIGFVDGDTHVEREVEFGVSLHHHLKIAQVESEHRQQVAYVISSLLKADVQSHAALQARGKRAHDQIVEVGSVLRVANHAVYVFGKRGVAFFYRLDKFELVERDLQLRAVAVKPDGEIAQTAAAGRHADGARAEVRNVDAGHVHAEAGDGGEHAVYQFLIDGNAQRVVIGAFRYLHPPVCAFYFEHGEDGGEQSDDIARNINVAVLRHGKRGDDARIAVKSFQLCIARYHAVVGAEETVYRLYRHFLDRAYHGRQVAMYLKAFAVPDIRAGDTADYLSDVYIYITLPIIYARDDCVVILGVFYLDGNNALVFHFFFTGRIRLLRNVEVDGKIQPVSEVGFQHQHAFGQNAGSENADYLRNVHHAAGSAQRAQRHARGHLNVTEAVCVVVMLHLGGHNGLICVGVVPVRYGDAAAVYFIEHFAGVFIDKGRGERDKIAVGVYGPFKSESAGGHHFRKIVKDGH